jgi:hypothetical protein
MFWRNLLPLSPGLKSKPSKKLARNRQQGFACDLLLVGFLFSLLFKPEDRGSTFLQKFSELLLVYKALHTRRQ